jgi:hypothetical protein
MFRLFEEMMPEGELVAVLCFDDTILLDGNLDSLPLG